MTRELERVKALFNKLTDSPLETFPASRKRLHATERQGVYVIVDPGGKIAHVGRTPRAKGGIAQRLYDHMYARSSFTLQHLEGDGSKLRGKYKFQYIIVDDQRQRALLEAYATGHLCPAHIGLG